MDFVHLIAAGAQPQSHWKDQMVLKSCGLSIAGTAPSVAETDDGTYYLELHIASTQQQDAATFVEHWVVSPKALTRKTQEEKARDELRAKVAARSILTYVVTQRHMKEVTKVLFVRSSTPRGPERMGWDAGRCRIVLCGAVLPQKAAPALSSPAVPIKPSPVATPVQKVSPPLAPQPTSHSGGGPTGSIITATFSSSAGNKSFASSTPPFHQQSSLHCSSVGSNGTSPQIFPVVAQNAQNACMDDFTLPSAAGGGCNGGGIPPAPTATLMPIVTNYDSPMSSPTDKIHVPFGGYFPSTTGGSSLGHSPSSPGAEGAAELSNFMDLCKDLRKDGLSVMGDVTLLDVVGDLPPPM